ncbi:hypothetical protein CRENBAI_026763 [Crenichthys baileyi]|uniref:Uncharacterized protein n=1 Tax=Crenichthys baileyi TaxID=28760 RepID=A0AAV9RH79_9TELE
MGCILGTDDPTFPRFSIREEAAGCRMRPPSLLRSAIKGGNPANKKSPDYKAAATHPSTHRIDSITGILTALQHTLYSQHEKLRAAARPASKPPQSR